MKITNRWNAAVIFESPCSTWKSTIQKAREAGANLCDADLRGADLCGANLRGADLRGADLRDANLCDANLCGADLRDANLCDANLCGANLRGADLRGAENADLPIAQTRILPEGELIVWKKARTENKDVLVQLRIPSDAKRSHAFGRKCRASKAVVLAIIGAKKAHSGHDSNFTYKVGDTIEPKESFCEDWQQECASGIHFFITKIEAENYSL